MTDKDPKARECLGMVLGIIIASVGFIFQLVGKACEVTGDACLNAADRVYEKVSGLK